MVRRVRAWRRSGDERSEAMVELLSGKAKVDHLGIRFGVNCRTVGKRREAAIGEYRAFHAAGLLGWYFLPVVDRGGDGISLRFKSSALDFPKDLASGGYLPPPSLALS